MAVEQENLENVDKLNYLGLMVNTLNDDWMTIS